MGKRHALITGGAGFIGSHLVDLLLEEKKWKITCVDNFDPYYTPVFKRQNIEQHINNPDFILIDEDICNKEKLNKKLNEKYDIIIHLAAKAGVRPSINNPLEYQKVNITGTQNLLEIAKERFIKQFIFSSSSSVYGINPKTPWSESENVLMPISPYASTKVSAELMGHVYSHLFPIRFIALRLFTVFGPRQRPDLAIYKFTDNIINDKEICMFGNGSTSRDYTYVQDVINGIRAAMDYDKSKFEIINIGNTQTITLLKLINALENIIGKKALIKKIQEQPGDVPVTFADISKAKKLLSYNPATDFIAGLKKFYTWFRNEKINYA